MRLIRDRSIILGSVLLLAACREAKVESYRVPKEASPPAPLDMPSTQSGPDMASTPVPTASGAELVWTTPDHWVAQPGAPMRKAGYKITAPDGGTAELTVTAFPGDVGGDLANVNRWRNQLQLAPLAAAELPATLQTVSTDALEFKLTAIDNGTQSTLAAWVMHDGGSWFFKLTGSASVVAAEKPAFVEFLKTIKAE
jgi:hypothetical protein